MLAIPGTRKKAQKAEPILLDSRNSRHVLTPAAKSSSSNTLRRLHGMPVGQKSEGIVKVRNRFIFGSLSLLMVAGFLSLSATSQPPGQTGKQQDVRPDDSGKPAAVGAGPKLKKPQMSDTIRANVYADNWFVLYINGQLTAVDSIAFIPHNVISVDLLPTYPMTIAVMARDNFDPKTGMEYANTNIGDGGFILKFADGTVTDAKWKAKSYSRGPLRRDTSNPTIEEEEIPGNWFAVDFDDSKWSHAKEFTEEEVGPKQPFFEHDFEGAKFIWSDDLALDNVVLFRHQVPAPPDGKPRIDYSKLNDIVPDSPPRQPRRNR